MASVKPSDPRTQSGAYRITPGRLNANNYPLAYYILKAYSLPAYRVEGMPGWANSALYDISAEADAADGGGQSLAERRRFVTACLQSLLEERFHLKFHLEKKMLPAFHLMLTKKGAFKLKPINTTQSGGKTGSGSTFSMVNGKKMSVFHNYKMKALASALSEMAGARVVDLTGIEGAYDFSLQGEADDAGESLFTSLKDIGLKLERAKAETDVFVIDRLERATTN